MHEAIAINSAAFHARWSWAVLNGILSYFGIVSTLYTKLISIYSYHSTVLYHIFTMHVPVCFSLWMKLIVLVIDSCLPLLVN